MNNMANMPFRITSIEQSQKDHKDNKNQILYLELLSRINCPWLTNFMTTVQRPSRMP